MQAQPTEPPGNGICVAHGYGLKIYVHRGHLIVHDGIGRQRQTRRYHRVTSKLRRLVLIGHAGYITLEALRWLHDIGAALLQIDADGQLLTTSTVSGPGLAGLRRAQAQAATAQGGIEVARSLLHAKVTGQASLLPELQTTIQAAEQMSQSVATIASAPDLPTLLTAEAEAASVYWGAWSSIPIPIAGRDQAKLPAHWLKFGQRASLITGGPRTATNPANAILNYLYPLLEAETTIACHTVGLDPLLGIFHTDQRSRPSLALDAMEAVRPTVDAYVLGLLTQRKLARADFSETCQGNCRLTPGLASRLTETAHAWRQHIGPVVEGVAQTLAPGAGKPLSLAAPLTRAQHRAAWAERGSARRGSGAPPTIALPNGCRDCGTYLADRRKRYCDDCRADRWSQHAENGRGDAQSVLAQLRSEQRDPAHGGRAAELRGTKNADHQAAVRAWTRERPDPELLRSEILPGLRRKPIGELVAATGLSEHYCSLIRLGKKVPHPRHWDALRNLPSSPAVA